MHSYSSNSFLDFLPSCFVRAPSPCFLFGLLLAFSLVKCTSLCTCIVCAALCPFGGLVVPCMSCPRGSWDCVGFVLLLVRLVVFLVLLRSSLFLGGPCCFPCCLPSFVVVPFSVLFAFPPPRIVLFGALVQLVPWFAGTSLWVSGCSCDGLVALPSCWECV